MKSLFLFSLFFIAQSAAASILINEIMYDLEGTDTDREWIEVYNSGAESVDLSGYKLFEAGVNHGLVLDTGDASVPGSGYVVIVTNPAKFKTDWPSYSGAIFDSSFSLSNEGETLAIKNSDLEVSDEYSYTSATGGTGDGKSLQKVSGSWVSATPTPGASNTSNNEQNNSSADNAGQENPVEQNVGESESGNASSAASATSSKKITIKMEYNSLIFAGMPTFFKAATLGINGEELIYGKYVWNFGDGVSLESKVIDKTAVSHIYYYPNDYVLTLEYYSSEYLFKPDATFQATVKVIPTSVYISNIGSTGDFFVELTNNSKYDIDVSLWRIVHQGQSFILPKNTIILKNQKVSYSPRVTNFIYSDSKDFLLYNANSDLVFDYKEDKTPKSQTKVILAKSGSKTSSINTTATIVDTYGLNDDVTADSLSARGYASLPEGYDKNLFVYGSGLLLLLGVSGSSVYFLRRSKRSSRENDDFEIVDE